MSAFFRGFHSADSVRAAFGDGPPDGAEILFAWYGIEFYEGHALVIYVHGGQMYEVHGSHCSCYGLERQWRPEATDAELLRRRYAGELRAGLDASGFDDDDIEAGGYTFDQPAAKALLALLTKETATP